MILRILLCMLVLASAASAETAFDAVRRKALWPDAKGKLVISEETIEFRKDNPEHSLTWRYRDIQHFDRISLTEIEILTYEDVAWKLGKDRSYRFLLVSGEISDALFEEITAKIGLPATDRSVDDAPEEAARLPVKRLTTFGGSEGELVFGDSAIFYITDKEKNAREWRIDRDVDSVWALNRYELELHVYESNRRDFGSTRVYRFQLKEPLDPEFYRQLKLRLYNLHADRRVIP